MGKMFGVRHKDLSLDCQSLCKGRAWWHAPVKSRVGEAETGRLELCSASLVELMSCRFSKTLFSKNQDGEQVIEDSINP